MFYNELKAIMACEDDPSLIFQLIKEGHMDVVDKVLFKKKVDLNIVDEEGNSVLMRLLKAKQFSMVLKYMKKENWDINHQNIDGDTFAHILSTIDYKYIIEIIKVLKKNKNFKPNIKNKKGQTILDKAIENNYMYTTLKILEDRRFTDIDIISFKKLYETFIKTNDYGKYTRLTNLEIVIKSIEKKPLLPKMKKLIQYFNDNLKIIKEEILSDTSLQMDQIINKLLKV